MLFPDVAGQFVLSRSGIRIEVILAHGHPDVYSSTVFDFPLSEQGKRESEELILALEKVSDIFFRLWRKSDDLTTEAICLRLAQATGLNYDWLLEKFEAVIRTDAVFPERAAIPAAYTVSVTTEEGIVHQAVFDDPHDGAVRYRAISPCDDTQMTQWK